MLRTRAAADLARRDADGRAGRLHPAPADRQDLRRHDRERGSPAAGRGRCGRAGERRQSARAQSRRPHLELVPPGAPEKPDHAADVYRWDVFVLCGDPKSPESGAMYHAGVSENGWFTDPDNMGVDPAGRLWVCTDGPPDAGFNDGALRHGDRGARSRAAAALLSPAGRRRKCARRPSRRTAGPCSSRSSIPASFGYDGEDAASVADADTNWPDFIEGSPPRPRSSCSAARTRISSAAECSQDAEMRRCTPSRLSANASNTFRAVSSRKICSLSPPRVAYSSARCMKPASGVVSGAFPSALKSVAM